MSTTATGASTKPTSTMEQKKASELSSTSSGAKAGIEERMFYYSYLALAAVLAITHFYPLPVGVQMMLYTFPIIYIGSHLSLKLIEIDPVTGAKTSSGEKLSQKDALLFPITGSAALFSLYLAYQFLSRYYVNLLLTAYLSLMGVAALAETLHAALVGRTLERWQKNFSFSISFPYFGKQDVSSSYEHVGCCVVAALVAVVWLATKHWILHNVFAIALCVQAIGFICVTNFKIASMLLVGLFVYDIFWVFGTNVMVTVAKSFEGPAKIIFPVSHDPWRQSILGLGDVVIPGVFIAMALRFDHFVHHEEEVARRKKNDDHVVAGGETAEGGDATAAASTTPPLAEKMNIHKEFAKPYFQWVFIAYETGLLVTLLAMFVSDHPQPALLYLVPACLIGLNLAAFLRNEIRQLYEYSEEDGLDNEGAAEDGGQEEKKEEEEEKKEEKENKKEEEEAATTEPSATTD
eukprot:GHVU01056050.1.p1 GENE.GHVU01056050.1~~GHVU01056050.1.p1  ORF type:complete len:462 (+),score=128.02 GHVU01056050.1:319-1704(+)